MKLPNKYNILLILLLLTAICGCRRDYTARLAQADELMNEHPDSALRLLEQIPFDAFSQPGDRARHALLLTLARDKNYIVQTDDSLIRTAVTYYDQAADLPMQARAHYLWGCVLRDRGEDARAVEKYLQAVVYAREVKNQYLLGRIYSQTGHLYYQQDLNEKADSIYSLMEQIAIQTKDTVLLIDVLQSRGAINRERKGDYYVKAEQQMLRAWKIACKIRNRRSIRSTASALSLLYSNMKVGDKALKYAKNNFALQDDTTNCYWSFSLLGEAYYHTAQYDSATIYLKKSLPTSNYGVKADLYMRLADVAKNQNNIELSLKYERLYSAYQDSMRMASQSNRIVAVEKEMELHLQQQQAAGFLARYRGLLCIAVLLAVAISLYIWQKGRTKARQLQDVIDVHQYTEARRQEAESRILEAETICQKAEDRRQELEAECRQLKEERKALLQERLEQSDVMGKINRIVADCKWQDKSAERMEETDWQQLMAQIDALHNDITLRLREEFQLKESEIHLCCLYLLGRNVSDMVCIMNYTRDNVYKVGDRILEKRMGYEHKEVELTLVLKKLCEKS